MLLPCGTSRLFHVMVKEPNTGQETEGESYLWDIVYCRSRTPKPPSRTTPVQVQYNLNDAVSHTISCTNQTSKTSS